MNLTEPVGPYGAVHGPSRKNMNLGIAKTIALKSDRYHLLLTVDCLNLVNTSVPWVQTWAEGPVYGFPTTIATPRALRWGGGIPAVLDKRGGRSQVLPFGGRPPYIQRVFLRPITLLYQAGS